MEDICLAETPLSSSNLYYDDRVSGKPSVANITSHCMAATNRPCDPRDFKKSRAYRFRTLDQNVCQLDTHEKSMVFLDRSILTPITDGDRVNDIKMTTNCSVEECDVIVSEEAVVDLTFNDSIDICMSETVEVMDIDVAKSEENTLEEDRKEDILVVVEGKDKIETEEHKKQDNKVLVDSKIEAEDGQEENVAVEKEDKMEVEDRRGESTKVVQDILEANDNNAVALLEENRGEDKMEVEDRSGESTKIVEDILEVKDNNTGALLEENSGEDKIEGRKQNNAIVVLEEEEGEDNMEAAEDTKAVVVEEEEDSMETAEGIMENDTVVRTKDNITKNVKKENKIEVEVDKLMDKMEEVDKVKENVEVDKIKKKNDKMEVEIPVKEQVKAVNCASNIDSTNKLSIINTAAVTNLRVKSELFHFNPEPIDDDLSLPSSKELSNQVLSNNLLRDIESLNDGIDMQLPVGSPMSRVLNKPLIPSCSAFRSSVLSNVTSTVRSGSTQSISGKQNTKDQSFTKSPRKNSSPRKVVHKALEKSVTKKPSVSRKNSESSESEKSYAAPVLLVPIKPKPVVEQVRKYTTRRTSCLDETKQVEHKPETNPVQEKTDVKLFPNKHASLQSPSHKDKSKSKSSQLNIKASKQTKSPSKTPTKSPPKASPPKTTPTRTPLTRQSAKLTSSPHTLTSTTSHSTRSHAKTMAKATASSSDPIPVWITWKCCLCSQGSSQDQLGFLYGPYKSQTDDCLSVGSKRTRDDTDNDSNDERQAASEMWVHEGCACWAPGVCLVGNELHGLAEAVKNAKDLECVGCHQPGATISCSNRGCKASFHYPCAIKSGCSLLPDQLLLLCHTHDTQEKTV